jgi:hypothetical protein
MMLRAHYIYNVFFLYFLSYSPVNHFPFKSLLQGIRVVACFPKINLRIFQTLCPVNVEVISFSCGHFLRAGGMLYYLSTTWQTERNFTAYRPNKEKQPDRDFIFTFCWPRIWIYSFKGRPTWCTIYLQYISSNTSTRFGRNYSPSSGGTTVGIQQLALILLFRWLSVVLAVQDNR